MQSEKFVKYEKSNELLVRGCTLVTASEVTDVWMYIDLVYTQTSVSVLEISIKIIYDKYAGIS
jgi:hypothetical protein